MFVAPFTFQQVSGEGAPAVAPALSSLTAMIRTDATTWGDSDLPPLAFPYTSASGNVLYLGCARSNASVTRSLVADWAGDATLPLAAAKQDGSNNLSCQAALKAGGLVGAGDFHVISDSAVPRFVYFLGWVLDLDQVRGGIGATAGAVIAVSQLFVEVTLAVSQPGSLLIAAGWNQAEGSRPFVWPAGWAKLDEQAIGAGNQPCGSIASKISTAAGPETVTMAGDAANGTWGIVVVELLRG